MSEDAGVPTPEYVHEEATMASSQKDYPLLTHYTVLIYPLLHNITSVNRRQRIQRLEESWSPWWARLEGNIHKALDDTYFFLPYIREVIFPETALLKDSSPGNQYANWVERLRQWNAKGLSYFCSELQQESVLRITYRDELLADVRDIEIIPPSFGDRVEQETMPPVRLEWIDAIMFPSGIGFLMLKAVFREASPKLPNLVDLNYYLRIVHPPSTDWTLTELRLGRMA